MPQTQQRPNNQQPKHDSRGKYHSQRSLDDVCWAIEDIMMTLHGVVALQHMLSMEIEREKVMDKKMHQVTKRMKTAVKDVKKGKPSAAVKVLKKAEKKNEKLVKIDRDVRDPMIKKCKAEMKKKPAPKKK